MIFSQSSSTHPFYV